MRIIISPAKKMNVEDSLAWSGLPVFLEQAEELKNYIRTLGYTEAKTLWKCNDKLAELNFARFSDMDLRSSLTPAVMSYEGIQYQYMAPNVMDERSLAYIQEHLKILSGFYGVLSPFDGIVPYRLEMQAKAHVGGCRDLYEYWGSRIYEEVTRGSRVILNLASKEYARCVEAYLSSEDTFLTVIFGELSGGKVIQKGTMAKMARGEMVRYMAEHQIEEPGDIRGFDRMGYRYCPERSSGQEYVFLREAQKGFSDRSSN